jgi:hypothetical protein
MSMRLSREYLQYVLSIGELPQYIALANKTSLEDILNQIDINGLNDNIIYNKLSKLCDQVEDLSRKINSIPINTVEVVSSLSKPGSLGELKFYNNDLFAWLPDTNQIPVRNAWIGLTFGTLDGGEVIA